MAVRRPLAYPGPEAVNLGFGFSRGYAEVQGSRIGAAAAQSVSHVAVLTFLLLQLPEGVPQFLVADIQLLLHDFVVRAIP
jgi:hypothetical protein